MTNHVCEYLIIGGGLAGASAVEGIRERDARGDIILIGSERHLPYDRPPLSKKLWFGKKEVKDIFLHDRFFYERNGVTLLENCRAMALDPENKTVVDNRGLTHRFNKLLLATGGVPLTLRVPGGMQSGICYYRTLDDYLLTRKKAAAGRTAVVVGGGFIGSEMAAALCANGLRVVMIYPDAWLCARVFTKEIGLTMERLFDERGIRMLKGQAPVAFENNGGGLVMHASGGERVAADLVIAGIGIKASAELAEHAGLAVHDGVIVNAHLQSAHPDIYAAGDVARFPYQVLGHQTRVEHWDNAAMQGRCAGRNMAGAHEAYTHMPYFFSDLFEFGYEAVGEVSTLLETVADWKKPLEQGVIYYLREGKIRGAMMCNVWDKVDAARAMIQRGATAEERLQ